MRLEMSDMEKIMPQLDRIEKSLGYRDYSDLQINAIAIIFIVIFILFTLIFTAIRRFQLRKKDVHHNKKDYQYLKSPALSLLSYGVMGSILVTGILLVFFLLISQIDYANSPLFAALLTVGTVFISVGLSMMIYVNTDQNHIIRDEKELELELQSKTRPFNTNSLASIVSRINKFKNKNQSHRKYKKELIDIEVELTKIIRNRERD